MIFDFSSHELSDDEKSLLCKGLNFLNPPRRLDYAHHMLRFELLFRDINKNEIPNEDKEFIKTKLKDFAFTSFRSHNYNSETNLTKNERLALNSLSNNKNITIQKSDKVNSVVLLDKDEYLEGVSKILNNNAKFEMLQFDHDKELNYILNLEKKIINVLKDLNNKEEITEVNYNHLHPCGSRPGILCGMAKVHKPVTDRCPSLRPILSAINTPSYKLAKFLVPLLTPLTSNDFTIKDSFSFAEEVSSFDCAHYITSFDIESLFTNIPLKETINICIDTLFENNTKVNNLTKESFRSLLKLATLDSFFIFNGKYYKQKDGVAISSPLDPTLANVFLCHFEEQWMSDCPIDYKPISYRRYVDYTVLLCSSELHVTM